MTTPPSENSQLLAEQLHALSIHLLRRLRRVDATSSLNAPRLSALSVIVFTGPITLGDLAAAEQVRPPTMTRIVKALEQQRLVQRQQNAADGRSIHLSATLAGKKLLLHGRARRLQALTTQLAQLTPKQRATLQAAAQILQKVVPAV